MYIATRVFPIRRAIHLFTLNSADYDNTIIMHDLNTKRIFSVSGIPYAFNLAGVGMGVILLALVAIVTDYSLVLMLRSAHISGSFSYQSLMKSAFGKYGFVVLSFLQFIYPFIGKLRVVLRQTRINVTYYCTLID